MSTPSYRGNTAFRDVRISGPTIDPKGFDTMTIEREGAVNLLDRERARWQPGSKAPGAPGMELTRAAPSTKGHKGVIRLEFAGHSGARPDNPTRVEYPTIQTTVTLTAEGVAYDFTYYPFAVDVEWISRGGKAPTKPQYGGLAPRKLNLVGSWFSPDYDGSVRTISRERSQLRAFVPTEIAANVWRVRETWARVLIAKEDPNANSPET